MNRFVLQMLLLLLGWGLGFPLFSAEPATTPAAAAPASPATHDSATNVFHPVKPATDDGRIAWTTAAMLELHQYLTQPFDAALSAKFFDRYLETYDPQHLHFLRSDLAEFDHYRTNLHHLILGPNTANLHRPGTDFQPDTAPADEIFNRFMERLEQRVAYVNDLLQREKFTFDADERIVINRKDLPYPRDLTEAKRLWRERIRAEYLQEKLGHDDAAKKAATTAAKKDATAKNGAKAAEKKLDAKPKTPDQEIVETLTRRYQRNLRTFGELDDEDVLQIFLNALAHVYDPHSDYMNKAQKDQFAIAMNLSLFGIGAELRSEDGYCTINRLMPGPAAESKRINERDRIIAVTQTNGPPVDLVDMRLDKAVQLIRGPKGTPVTLTILPAGAEASARFDITLIRREIKIEDQEAKAKVVEIPDSHGQSVRLGVIDLPSFYAPFDTANSRQKAEPKYTSVDVSRLLQKMKQEKVSGVILDLRHNGGGSLEEAIRLTGLFIKTGPVVQVKNHDGVVEEEEDRDPSVIYGGPLIVLTSRLSASASEIVAGALQDYGRALIVGDTSTHGKGTVQTVVPVNSIYTQLTRNPPMSSDPGDIKVTIKKFYRPSGATTQKIGVIPDIILPSILGESKEIGESTLDNPLEADTIPGVKFDHLNLVSPYLPELKKRCYVRLASDPEYTYIREDIEQYKKLQADKTISLNEKQRLKQKEQDDLRAKSRDKERLARKPLPGVVHELTLKQVDLPGLPPPAPKTNTVAKASSVKVPAEVDELADGALDEEKPTAVDAALNEAEHVLLDYLYLMPKDGILTAGPTSTTVR